MNITDPIRAHARATPDAPAILRRNGAVTYRQLDRLLDALALRAIELGLAPGDRVGLAFPDTPGSQAAYRFLTLALAMARIGVATKAAEPDDEGFAACLMADATTRTRAPRRVVVDGGWFESPPASVEIAAVPASAGGSAVCRVFSTSGTTGTSKRVAISHEIMNRRIEGGTRLGPYPQRPVVVVHIGPWSGVGFRNMLRALHAGGAILLARRPDEILHGVIRRGVNYMLLAPATLAAIVDAIPAGHGPFPGLEWVEVTGSFLPQPLYEKARTRLTPNIVTSYGSTEAGNIAWARRADLEGSPGAVGFLLPWVEVEAVDADGAPLPAGEVGEIRIRTRTAVACYEGDDRATASAFRNGWFHPGDLGSVSADRMLSIVGRVSDLINIGGNKVGPRVVEDALLGVPGIADAAAFGVPDANGIPEVWAAIVVRGTLARSQLDATCRGLAFAAPKRILTMDALPRNANGKVLRDELVRLALSAPGAAAASRGASS